MSTPEADQLPPDYPPTGHTRVKRLHERARYDREAVHAILDAGLLCHVGYVIEGQPYVTPTAYWRAGERVYWHGSSASRMLRHLKGRPRVCFTVALMDGLVLARSGFHSSVNYRSVMAFGEAEVIEDPREKLAALADMMERIVPGRWPTLKPPTPQELKATTVVSLALEEVVAKVRSGPPKDDPEDYALDVWAGVVPTAIAIGRPASDPDLKAGIAVPENLSLIRIG